MSERVAYVFPGQGSQTVGMGADVVAASAAARALFERADQALGFPLSTLCFDGPEETLKETINTQPAIVAVSLALLAALEEYFNLKSASKHPQPEYVAGHSVGEYTAVVASGALDVEAALLLVRERGRLMHEEGAHLASGMAAILGMEEAALQDVCTQATEETLAQPDVQADTHPGMGRVVIANYNSPGQLVIAGEQRAMVRALELASARGAKRVVPLAVSGAFHSPVMQPASVGLARAVAEAPLRTACIPVVSNISAVPLMTVVDLQTELARQIISPVQWTKTVEFLVGQGVSTIVEIGPGQVLTGLVKRIAKGVTSFSLSTVSDVERVGAALLAAE